MDLRVDDVEPAQILAEGDAWVLQAGPGRRPVQVGEPFEVGSLRLVLRAVEGVPRSTASDGDGHLLPYEVVACLARGSAEIRGPAGDVLCDIRGDTGATLLYVLAQALAADAGRPELERGWCDDGELVTRVWGRSAREIGQNRLKVSLHRLRHRLTGAGVAGELVERSTGRTRLRAARVSLVD